MVVELQRSGNVDFDRETADCLGRLCHGHLEGEYVLLADPRVLGDLADYASPRFSEAIAAAQADMDQRWSEIVSLRDKCALRVMVEFDGEPCDIERAETGGEVIRLSLRDFETQFNASRPLILLENRDDWRVYEIVRDWYVNHEIGGVTDIQWQYEVRGAGGSTLAQEIRGTTGRFGVAIADRDVVYCGGPLGSTAEAAIEAAANHRTIVLVLTPCRSIESLVPCSFLLEVCKLGEETMLRLKRVSSIYNAFPRLPLYFSYKKQLLAVSIAADTSEGSSAISSLIAAGVAPANASQCTHRNRCGCKSCCVSLCDAPLQKAVKHFADHASGNEFLLVDRHLSGELREMWQWVGSVVFAATVSQHPVRAT